MTFREGRLTLKVSEYHVDIFIISFLKIGILRAGEIIMQESVKFYDKEIQKAQANAQGARQQAEAERGKASQYDEETQPGQKDFHFQQADLFDQRAQEFEQSIPELESQKAQTEAKIAELKTERETINRETLEKTIAIDKELARLQGSMSI